jgi:hypothetical protein
MNSGTYNYFLNGEPTGVVETFEIKKLSDGSKKTISTRDATPFNTIITVETTEENDKFQNCKINYRKDELQVEAVYKFAAKTFDIIREINDEIVQNDSFDFPENAIFFPLMRCFQGNTILQVAENQSFTTVIVPDVQPSTDFEKLLQPTFDERTAEWIGLGTIKLNGKLTDAKVHKYLSKHYDEKSEFWIAPNGLLFSYDFHQSDSQTWSVCLQQN